MYIRAKKQLDAYVFLGQHRCFLELSQHLNGSCLWITQETKTLQIPGKSVWYLLKILTLLNAHLCSSPATPKRRGKGYPKSHKPLRTERMGDETTTVKCGGCRASGRPGESPNIPRSCILSVRKSRKQLNLFCTTPKSLGRCQLWQQWKQGEGRVKNRSLGCNFFHFVQSCKDYQRNT